MTSAGYHYSKNTPAKQRDFEAAIDLHIRVTSAILRKTAQYKPLPPDYLYLDLNAGLPKDPTGILGSTAVFLKTASWRQLPFKAEFYDIDAENCSKLNESVTGQDVDRVQILNTGNHDIINRHPKYVKYQYGAAYVDPSNAEVPFDVLKHLAKVYPRLDFVINLACASYKRPVNHPDYVPLDETLPKLKRFWKVREPIAKQQWSIMIGTNWDNYPDLNPALWRFHDTRTSKGREIYERLVWTKNQRGRNNAQMGLWGDQL